ncbi:hypothetical protein GY45DRAFT_1323829 [Cubamyces sp. BRFM 1775]|nr:hypothetical protein GY45DRAFT_1323829 [Cubamyces sp. BRFM 1775]
MVIRNGCLRPSWLLSDVCLRSCPPRPVVLLLPPPLCEQLYVSNGRRLVMLWIDIEPSMWLHDWNVVDAMLSAFASLMLGLLERWAIAN